MHKFRASRARASVAQRDGQVERKRGEYKGLSPTGSSGSRKEVTVLW